MKPFRERNPVPIGVIGVVALAVVLAAVFNIGALPFVGGGRLYHADFSGASGLRPRDQVRIAGVTVGTVERVELEGAHVRVDFRVNEAEFGGATRAKIKVATVLGNKYLALLPGGGDTLPPGSTIPLSRTEPAFSVREALSGLTETVGEIDTKQLATALDTLSATFRDTPEEVRGTLRGLTRLSRTISSRDAKLRELLRRAENVTAVLAERNDEFTTLLADADKLLRELRQRRAVIHQLLVHTVQLSDQLVALVNENQGRLEPALADLHQVVDVLRRKQRNLERGLELLAPFVRKFTDTLGTGRWFDVYVQNLVPVPATARRAEN